MRIKAQVSYNLDILCFVNIMTADKYYIDIHPEMYERFYPLISDETKKTLQNMVKKQGHTMLSPTLTLLLSSLSNFNDRDLVEMLGNPAEIETSINNTPYIFSREKLDLYFSAFDSAIIPLINELEEAGFKEFWEEHKLPLIKEKCNEINEYMKQYNLESHINQFKNFDNSDFTVYLCSFTKPYGIKLCGNNLISDCSYKNQIILSNVTHEAFHPPYKENEVKQAIDVLGGKPWVIDAFKNQNPNSGYHTMEGFIEENIVEALGIYVLVQLGIDIGPNDYFKTHDEGSHVISPHFYRYLCEVKKDGSQSFEDYFMRFADDLGV